MPIILDTSSLGNQFEYSAYKTLTEDVIGSVKFFAKTVNGLQGEDTRLSSRLFIPGNRLRGFNTRKVGPKDGENYVEVIMSSL